MNSRDKAIARRKAEDKRKAEAEGCEANERRPDGLESSVSDRGVSPNECKTDTPIAEIAGASGAELTRSDLVTVRRAIRNDWPYDKDQRAELMEELHRIATQEIKVVIVSDQTDIEREIEMSGRLKVAAAKTIMAGDSINAKRESNDITSEKQKDDKSGDTYQFNGNVSFDVQTAIGMEPEYIRWLRARELGKGSNPVTVGTNGYKPKILGTSPSTGT